MRRLLPAGLHRVTAVSDFPSQRLGTAAGLGYANRPILADQDALDLSGASGPVDEIEADCAAV